MILLQAQGSGAMMQMLFLVGMFVVFYFFMIRPQQKKQQEHKKFIEGLQKGDAVVTIGGLHGKVVSIDEATITIDAGGASRLIFEKAAVSRAK